VIPHCTPASRRPARGLAAPAALLLALAPAAARAQADSTGPLPAVRVVRDAAGARLQVDGRDFLVRGMNWDYIPIGYNHAYDLWSQPDDMITAALDREMSLLAGMGVNVIRVYAGIPPRWVRYIHDRYGISCIINHTVGRYGYTLDGVWQPSVDYSAPRMRAALAADVAAMVERYRGVRGVLLYLLGNENNYGLSWSSFEIEALPKGEREAARARHLYSLFGEIIRATKARDPRVPVAISNGDVQYVDLIAEECKDLDIFGTNVYRGISARDLFQVVRQKLGVPVLFTEFGADAFNAREMREDQATQARYLIGQWHEIYEQSSGHGREGNAIGGCVFQWSDGWWKYRQEERLDVHDATASWPNGGYAEDFVQGDNNMNEEWWGICAKGPPDSRGLYELYPRAAYYALRRVFAFDPYAPGAGDDAIRSHFAAITPVASATEARGDAAALATRVLERARVSGVRMQFETFSTGADLSTTPSASEPGGAQPSARGFDHLQSFYAEFQAQPTPAVTANLSLNVLGHVPSNPIDQIFYENRGLERPVQTDSGTVVTGGLDRVRVYQASLSWEDRWFSLQGFYRTGHYHWGYEGDFFGLYREANYGPNIDVYNAEAPVGFELAGKRAFNGLKAAFGPQIWWGAPPTALLKYRRQVGRFDATAVLEKDLPTREAFTIVGSTGVRLRATTKTTLHLKTVYGPLTIEGGGIWSGADRVDEPFPVAVRDGTGYRFLRDVVRDEDALGAKFRIAGAHGRLLWYAQGASMGVVAEAGPTATTIYTGWTLKDSGLGNQRNVVTGFTYMVGPFQLGPNVLWQKPIVGPVPPEATRELGIWRDNFKDPFSVRSNREMTAAEFLVSYDPTPATWLYAWDNDVREDARLAGGVGFVHRHLPTAMDPAIGFFSEAEARQYGTPYYAFEGSTPARDLWEVNLRAVSRLGARTRIVAHAFYGTGEPTLSNDPRLVWRRGADLKVASGSTTLATSARLNDWGPYDYHRDFNLTFPVQLMGDLSYSLGTPLWFETQPQTRIGVRVAWRSLDQHSSRYTERYQDLATRQWYRYEGAPHGNEWEIRTYLRLAL
jgi:hypothetical protein